MKHLYLFLSLILISVSSNAQTDSKEKLVREMLSLSGSGKMGVQMMTMMMDSYKKAMPSVNEEFWEEFKKEVTGDDLVDLIVPVYVKHFTEDELKELITFYKSPIGKKLVEKIPLIHKESFAIGEAWGKTISEKITNKLKASGYYQ